MEIDPYVRNDWSCEDVLNVSVCECMEVTCCYPCVYAAALSRECSATPTQPRSLCCCTPWGCPAAVFPPAAGVLIRVRQQQTDGPASACAGLLRATAYETCCCICVGAPCAMNEFRCETPLNIGRLLLDSTGEFTVVDRRSPAYIAPSPALSETPCPNGSSPERPTAGCPPSPPQTTAASPTPPPRRSADGSRRTDDRSESDSD